MTPTVAIPRRVLAVGAHPDDIELLCAGTLAKFMARGSTVELAIACRGDRGGASTGPDPAVAAQRHGEARAAAAILGAPVHFLDFGDADVWDSPDARRVVTGLIREVCPELILTHGPDDYHVDHVTVGALVGRCAWFAASPGHATAQRPVAVPPAVFYMDNLAGMAFEPTHLVDVTETFDVKRRMLACHDSQLDRAGGLHELAETLARLRGFQAGVQHAEGFRPAPLWGRRRTEPVFP